VIYHGDGQVAERALDEIRRVLVRGGYFIGTMLSKRNARYGRGREVRPDTFVIDDATGDEIHPHFYCNTSQLLHLLRDFEVLDLRDRDQAPATGAYHWEFMLERATA